jgi:hypothetical protein
MIETELIQQSILTSFASFHSFKNLIILRSIYYKNVKLVRYRYCIFYRGVAVAGSPTAESATASRLMKHPV